MSHEVKPLTDIDKRVLEALKEGIPVEERTFVPWVEDPQRYGFDLQQSSCPECGGNLVDYAKFNGSIVNPHAPGCENGQRQMVQAIVNHYPGITDESIALRIQQNRAAKSTIWERLRRWFT